MQFLISYFEINRLNLKLCMTLLQDLILGFEKLELFGKDIIIKFFVLELGLIFHFLLHRLAILYF